MSRGEGQKERGRGEKKSQADSALSSEPDKGLVLRTLRFLSRNQELHLTD